MTLSIKETGVHSIKDTGVHYKCSNCEKKTVAVMHNGMLVVRVGDNVVFAPTLSVVCRGCRHVNHLSAVAEKDVVR